MLEFVGILILILILIMDPYANFKQIYYGAIVVVLVFLFQAKITSYAVLLAVLILFSLVVHFSSRSSIYQEWMTPLSTGFMLLLILSAVVPYIRKWADVQTGAAGILVNLILFIPCLLYDLGQYLVTELKNTPAGVWKLFIGLILASLAYFRGHVLLNSVMDWFRPPYIQKDMVRFGTALEPQQHTIVPDAELPVTNFTISFWLYNNESRTGKAHTVLNYGSRPHIQVRHNQLFISNDGSTPQLVGQISLQKWVHIALVYERNVCNVFIDGEFVKTLDIPAKPLTRTTETVVNKKNVSVHSIVIGDDEVFGDGGLKLLRVVNYPMTKTQIQTDKGRAVL